MFIKYGLNCQIMALVGAVGLFLFVIAIWFQESWIGTLGALALFGDFDGCLRMSSDLGHECRPSL